VKLWRWANGIALKIARHQSGSQWRARGDSQLRLNQQYAL
jgi:hypothetical protein